MSLETISSWSGGKDSCLACYKALGQGRKIQYLLNFISKEYRRCCFHGIEAKLLKLQAELTGISLVQKAVGPGMQEYEAEFKKAVSELKNKGFGAMVFGDVYLEEHNSWVERVSKELHIQPIQPLWGIAPDKVVEDFIASGFKAIVVSCNAEKLGKEFIGREVDRDLLEELKQKDICPCGENGEFHTFVLQGPLFKGKIEITKSRVVLKEGFGKYWFLDIQDYRVV
ncbi:MAG: diphthine--ammonia ligase [Candidatus Omnitrophica bacterium]|nr:diphthine--ammonia ligase [Candidatus Omnitrophota bacterium]